jgi:hypothetical protein
MSHSVVSRFFARCRARAIVGVLGAVVAIACMPVTAALARPAGPGPTLGGFTSQDLPVVVIPSADGRSLVRIGTVLNFACSSGERFLARDGFTHARLARDGGLRVTAVVPPTQGQDGSTYSVTDRVTGRLHRQARMFTGTWRQHVDFTQPGQPDDHCDTGPVTFTARL